MSTSPVAQAERVAKALARAAEARALKAERETKRSEINFAVSDTRPDNTKEAQGAKRLKVTTVLSAEREEEKRLNLECMACKKSAAAQPSNAELAAAYSAAKEKFRAFQKSKLATTPTWRCALCKVTMPASGQAVHEQGKAHQKKVLGAGAPSDCGALFECRLCGCTVAATAASTHQVGKKHCAKQAELVGLWRTGTLRRGDWVCPAHGWHVQRCYASKQTCYQEDCEGTKESGLSFEEVQSLVSSAVASAKKETAVKGRTKDGAALATSSPAEGELTCRDCEVSFVFGAKELAYYESKGFATPTRCLECRSKKRKRLAAEGEYE